VTDGEWLRERGSERDKVGGDEDTEERREEKRR
jgi:hypothetical protein